METSRMERARMKSLYDRKHAGLTNEEIAEETKKLLKETQKVAGTKKKKDAK